MAEQEPKHRPNAKWVDCGRCGLNRTLVVDDYEGDTEICTDCHNDDAAELARLRAWKDQATAVLGEWEVCYDILAAAGFEAPIGRSKAIYVADELREIMRLAQVMEEVVADDVTVLPVTYMSDNDNPTLWSRGEKP